MKILFLALLLVHIPIHSNIFDSAWKAITHPADTVKSIGHAITHPGETVSNLTDKITEATGTKNALQSTVNDLTKTKDDIDNKIHSITKKIDDITTMAATLGADIANIIDCTTSTIDTIKDNEVPIVTSLINELEKTDVSFSVQMLTQPKLFMQQISGPILHTKKLIDHITNIIANISDDTLQIGTFIKDLGRYLDDLDIVNGAQSDTNNVYTILRDIRDKIKDIQNFEKEADIIIPQILDDTEIVLTELSKSIQLIAQKGLLTASKVKNNVQQALKKQIDYTTLSQTTTPMSSIKMISVQSL